MSVLSGQEDLALGPVRDWLLADARREAEQLVRDARREAAEHLARARADAESQVELARSDGEAQAAEAVDRALARARRQARGKVLAARQRLRAQVREAVQAAAPALRQEPGYALLQARLTAAARDALGPDAEVREAPGGGVVAHAGSRRVDLSLPTLAERALAAMEGEVAGLWSD